MDRTLYMVQPAKHEDGWEVRKQDADRASKVENTKSEALDAGRDIAHNESPSELLIRLRTGEFQVVRSYD